MVLNDVELARLNYDKLLKVHNFFFFGYVWDLNLIESSLVCSKVVHSATTQYVCNLHPAENLSNSEHATVKALFIHFKHFYDCFT